MNKNKSFSSSSFALQAESKFYVATAIPYVNGSPHIGHVCDAVLSDVVARYHRLLGEDVFYLAGVDKNGQKNYQMAQKEGLDAKQFVDRNSQVFLNLYKRLESSFDLFIETTDEKIHHPGVVKFWNKLASEGDIYKDTYEGLYCVGHEAFLTESDLVDGKCPDHPNKPLEKLREENYVFRYSKYVPEVIKKIESGELEIVPEFRKHEMLNLLKENSGDVSFSRPFDRVPWGIKVPGDESQVIYVWADALVNYITGVGYGRDDAEFEKWWPTDVNVLGKDILRFHAGLWPAMLMSAKLNLPKVIFVHGFVNVGGAKLSKSTGNVVDPLEKIDQLGADALRYFLLSEGPVTQDIDFTNERFEEKYNSDLANGLGNLVSRVATLAQKAELEVEAQEEPSFDEIYKELAEEFKFNDALEYIWELIATADKEITDKKPWELLSSNPDEAKKQLTKLVLQLREIAFYLRPFLPETADKILKIFSGPKISKAEPLFPRLEKK